jgi:hypothetical protein
MLRAPPETLQVVDFGYFNRGHQGEMGAGMFRSIGRLDRGSFAMWALALIAAHIVLAVVTTNGTPGIGGIDTVVIILLARALAGRFRDTGWPVWIGSTFMIVTMLILPLAVVGVAISSHSAPTAVLQWLNPTGLIVGLADLALVVVIAGRAPGKDEAAEPARSRGRVGRGGLRKRTAGCGELAQQSQQPQDMVDKSTNEHARLRRLASSELFTKRDMRVRYPEGRLVHRVSPQPVSCAYHTHHVCS